MEVYRRLPPAGEAQIVDAAVPQAPTSVEPPGWFARLRPGGRHPGALGDVATELEVLALTGEAVEAVVRYSVDDLRWEQWFRAARLDVDSLDAELAAAGLRRTGWLTPDGTWFAAVASGRA